MPGVGPNRDAAQRMLSNSVSKKPKLFKKDSEEDSYSAVNQTEQERKKAADRRQDVKKSKSVMFGGDMTDKDTPVSYAVERRQYMREGIARSLSGGKKQSASEVSQYGDVDLPAEKKKKNAR